MARRERQGTGDRGDDLSLDHPNSHTLDAVFLSPSAKQGKGWTERPGSCVLSPRLVSFPSFWIWGNCPNWTGRPRE